WRSKITRYIVSRSQGAARARNDKSEGAPDFFSVFSCAAPHVRHRTPRSALQLVYERLVGQLPPGSLAPERTSPGRYHRTTVRAGRRLIVFGKGVTITL